MSKKPEIVIGNKRLMPDKKDFHNNGLHRLKIDNGIFLDGERLRGVLEYGVCQQNSDDYATLTLKMDVKIYGCGQKQKVDENMTE